MTGRSCRNTGEGLPAVMNTPQQQPVSVVASYPFIKLGGIIPIDTPLC
jgi:hypothetical protein